MIDADLLKEARLRFANDKKPGFSRKLNGEHYDFYDKEGNKIDDEKVIERIRKLAIPPAWKRVWISPYANGHLQAVGYDDKGRKQYRYHPEWNKVAQEQKFEHLLDFAQVLPKIRERVQKDLKLVGMPREKVLAAIVWLLENTMIRVGNEEYVKENKSYGLTTLKNRHVDVDGHTIKFEFKGKSGVYHKLSIRNKKVAKIVQHCQDIPGQELFEYIDDEGQRRTVSSEDVNDYLREISGQDITAKNFRTWGGTTKAAKFLNEIGCCEDEKEVKKNMVDTVKFVASHLRNKPATCRKYYIHPVVLSAYQDGYILSTVEKHPKFKKLEPIIDLNDLENQVVGLLSIFAITL